MKSIFFSLIEYTISMSRFLLMSHIWPPAIDGGSRVIYKMGEYLQTQGHQVSIITTNCRSTDDFTSSRRSQIKFGKDGPNIHRYPVITIFHRPFKLLGRFFPNFKTFAKGPLFSPVSCFSFLVSCILFLVSRFLFLVSRFLFLVC